MSEKKYAEDLELLHKYLCGDRCAGEKLFAQSYPAVRNYVFSHTQNDEFLSENDKEDIISESMIRVIDNVHFYKGTAKFQNFVIGYAKNIIWEQRRKKAKETHEQVSIDKISDISSNNLTFEDPLKVIIRKEELEAVQKALDLLPEEQKHVLILRVFNELPFKQLAELIGKSNDAADSLFRRALRAFKNNFEKIYNGATDY